MCCRPARSQPAERPARWHRRCDPGSPLSPLADAKPNAVRAPRQRSSCGDRSSPQSSGDVAPWRATGKGCMMHPQAHSATLNVQPRQRRTVYDRLATLPAGRSVRELLDDFEMPETELRETLRKLDQAGLARRGKGVWQAIPIEQPDRDSTADVVA